MDQEKEKKHILFLPEWYPNPDDLQLAVFVEKFARAAAQHSKVSLIYCGPFAKSNKIDLILRKEGNLTLYFCFYPKQKRKLKAYNYYLKAHQMCFDKLKEDGIPELVHMHMLFRNYLAYSKIYAKKIKKFLITEQWSGYMDGTYTKLPFYKKRYYKEAMRKAYFVTAVSNSLKASLNKLFEIQNNVIVLPNIAESVSNNCIKSSSEFRILVVADLVDEIKNISGVIDSFTQAQIDKPAVLTIVGDGQDREKLVAKINHKLLVNKRIEFKGRFENQKVLEEMQENHILITNSNHETFSMVTAEALLAGLPVICTKCGGPEEFVNEENGILIDVNSPYQLTNAIVKMSQTHLNYDSGKLSKTVLERFGMKTVAEKLNTLYEEILS
jgi:glycosyltransferase involved in cell wall biosynthesis